jgi:hypothetical protein
MATPPEKDGLPPLHICAELARLRPLSSRSCPAMAAGPGRKSSAGLQLMAARLVGQVVRRHREEDLSSETRPGRPASSHWRRIGRQVDSPSRTASQITGLSLNSRSRRQSKKGSRLTAECDQPSFDGPFMTSSSARQTDEFGSKPAGLRLLNMYERWRHVIG